MKVAIMQPYIFPYLGYFQLISAVDTFVFYDDVNFKKKSFINRNSILVNGHAYTFTIPCRNVSQNKLIKDIQLDFTDKEFEKFFKTLSISYSKAPYFEDVLIILKRCFSNLNNNSISSLAINCIKNISDYLMINVNWKISSEHHSEIKLEKKEDRLIAITKREDATNYINLIGGMELYDKDYFKANGINLFFIKQNAIEYRQNTANFIPSLSIIDVLMFNSKEEINKMLQEYILL